MPHGNATPIKIFFAYSRSDGQLLKEIRTFLQPLERRKDIQIWYDGEIKAGEVWEESIKKNLHAADIILLLLSSDALASDYFWEHERADALVRHRRGECLVVPVILRHCNWEITELAELQALPKDAIPVTDWISHDKAYKSISDGIVVLINQINSSKQEIQDQQELEKQRQLRQKEAEKQERLRQKEAAEQRHKDAEAAERLHQENLKRIAQEEADNKRKFWEKLQTADKFYAQQQYAQALNSYIALQNWGDKNRLGYTDTQPHISQRIMRCQQEQQNQRNALLKKIAMGVGGVLLVFALVWGMNQWAGNTHSIKPELVDTPFVAPRTDTAHRDTTSPPIAGADAYTMLLNEGNELFVKAEYVAAKAKYAAALKQRPKDPTATANIKKCDDKLKPPPIAPQEQATVQPKPKPVADPFASQMVLIRGGTFMMGSPASEADRGDDEQQHRVTLSDYYIGAYEVTQAQWRAVMGKNPSNFKGDNLPVENVSWDDIQDFLDKLNAQTGKKYRLPTEAQWEYAARGGTTTPFYTGKCLSTDQANYDGNYPYQSCAKGKYREKTTSVGSFAANAYGLYDMHGNVWEWCHDWYGADYYKNSPTNNPTGPSTGSSRVLRGGSWRNIAQGCRVANRHNYTPANRNYYYGFRLAVGP